MQQRASIARALAFDPDLLLMDEPFGALDEIVRDQLNEQLLRLWDATEKTVVFVTHSIPEAVFLSTRIVVMSPRPGRIIDVIDCDLPRDRTLDIRETPEFLEDRAPRPRRACGPGTPMTTEAPCGTDRRGTHMRPDRARAPGRQRARRSLVVSLLIVALWYPRRGLMNADLAALRLRDAGRDVRPRGNSSGHAVAGAAARCRRRTRSRSELWKTVVDTAPTSKRSLVYHAWITLSSTLLGFVFGTALGILLAVLIVHVRSLDRSLMPWIIASQTIPILAHRADDHRRARPAIGITGLVPEGDHLDLSVLLPGHGRHGEGPALARADASRPDAHLQCQPRADLLEAARAGLGAVPVHLA